MKPFNQMLLPAAAAVLLLLSGACRQADPSHPRTPADFVNPLIGTARENDGAVCPYVGRPYAMTKFTPQTAPDAVCETPYAYEDSTVFGFLASHKPLVGCMGDYGYVSLMPQTGAEPRTTREARALRIDKASETAAPYRYGVTLLGEDGPIGVRMAAASRAGALEFSFPEGSLPRVVVQGIELDPAIDSWLNNIQARLGRGMEGWIRIDAAKREIVGYNPDRMSDRWGPELPNFKGWFVLRFDRPFTVGGFFDGERQYEGQAEGKGTRSGVWVDFAPGTRRVRVQLGTSFISVDQARANLKELKGFSIDRLARATRKAWDEKLRLLTVEGVSDTQKRIFYTALFHAWQLPRELTEDGRYYSPFDDRIHTGASHTDYATWDTFRALHPLMVLLEPHLSGEWVQSLLQAYQEGGWLPKWPNPSYTNVMIGTHADAIIADAYTKGVRGYDSALALEAMLKDATTPPDEDTLRRFEDREDTRSYEARAGLTWYRTLGYVPADRTAESVSRTVEFGIDDWAIAQVARDLGRDAEAEMLLAQSKGWRKLYDAERGFLIPRHSDGSWMPFDTLRAFRENWYTVDGAFTEANPWNYLFGAMHDVGGLLELMGPERFRQRLDQVYDLGKYNHGNEPAHHYDYLFNYTDTPWKTQEKVREDVRAAYWDAPEGMVGNDDCGQMSAWYLFSCMGLYPLCPGSRSYEFGAPQVPCVRMRIRTRDLAPEAFEGPLPGDHTLTFRAEGLSDECLYVKEIQVDGVRWKRLSITHEELLRAREIRFVMADKP